MALSPRQAGCHMGLVLTGHGVCAGATSMTLTAQMPRLMRAAQTALAHMQRSRVLLASQAAAGMGELQSCLL